MPTPAVPFPRLIRLRYPGLCNCCGFALPVGTRAEYDRAAKLLTCATCNAASTDGVAGQTRGTSPPSQPAVSTPGPKLGDGSIEAVGAPPVQAGTAGASALRMYEHRKGTRESRVRGRFPRFGGLLLALFGDPQSTKAWATGARGEEIVGAMLDRLTERGVHVLHDRRIPGGPANIDHIAVAASGVFVIDAKHYKGQPRLRVDGGLFRPRIERLFVAGRDRTNLAAGVHKQMGLITRALGLDSDVEVPIVGKLCFVEADWPLLGGSFSVQDVEALSPRVLRKELLRAGPLSESRVRDIHRRLAAAFPEA
jgi:Nuclease-related domain